MNLVKVIPITKIPLPNPQVLTYFSSLSLKRGALVMVPLGKRNIYGIAVSKIKLTPNKKIELKKSPYQLKPIKKVILSSPVVNLMQLKLAKWAMEYYYESLGSIIKLMIPKRILSIKRSVDKKGHK